MLSIVLLFSTFFFQMTAEFGVRKAVIPAGGMGTRFLPVTKSVSKVMLPIGDKPVIHLIIEEAQKSGITECLLITSDHKDAIENYFTPDKELSSWLQERNKGHLLDELDALTRTMVIRCIDSETGLGVGYAVGCAKDYIEDDFFAAIWPDNLIASKIPCTKQLIEIAQKVNGTVIAVDRVSKKDMTAYGMVEVGQMVMDNVWKVTALKEKPKIHEVTSDLAVIGRFILSKKVFSYLDQIEKGIAGEYWLEDALQDMIENGEPVYACLIDGIFFDTGVPNKWAKAVAYNDEYGI